MFEIHTIPITIYQSCTGLCISLDLFEKNHGLAVPHNESSSDS